MRSFSLLLMLLLLPVALLKSQDYVATIDGEGISKGEFLYAFNKNRSEETPISLDSLEAYLEQFINFKLKVKAARQQGLDKDSNFQAELKSYISQIRKPYLENENTTEKLVTDTYEKMKLDIQASHILLKVSPDAPPSDTLKAYTFLDSLRRTIGSHVEFQEVAKAYSEDGSSSRGGNLGWFTAMQMVEPFEEAAYQTPVGQISPVVRTQFGYHLIYVTAARPNEGKVKTSHIFFTKQRGEEEALQRANMVYDSLLNGANWDQMARIYSDDQGTRTQGGALPWASLKQLPDDYLDLAYSINEIGEFTEPGETAYGYHIIRLDDQIPLEPLPILREEIESKLKRMGRNSLQEEQVLKKLKLENDFELNTSVFDGLISQLVRSSTQEIDQQFRQKTLFRLGRTQVKVKDFLSSIPGNSIKFSKSQINQFYADFEKKYILNYEDSIAPQKYPEYRFLMQEYEEGLLLFEIMQREVWNKSLNDSIALRNYYTEHIENYKVGEQLECLMVQAENSDQAAQIRAFQLDEAEIESADSLLEKWLDNNELSELKIAKSKLAANEFPNFEQQKQNLANWLTTKKEGQLCLALKYLDAGPQDLKEIKGIVMADYQDELDQQWIIALRKNAKIKVNRKVLKQIAEQ